MKSRISAPIRDAMKPALWPSLYQPMTLPEPSGEQCARDAEQHGDDDAAWILARHDELGQSADDEPDDRLPQQMKHVPSPWICPRLTPGGGFPVRSMVSPFYRGVREICRRACKPNSVEDGHSSRRGIAADVHQRPTRRFPLRRLAPPQGPRGRAGPARDCRRLGQPAVSLPIWSCSVWGLPCLRPYSRSGALLPHLFTLTLALAHDGGIFSVALAVPAP